MKKIFENNEYLVEQIKPTDYHNYVCLVRRKDIPPPNNAVFKTEWKGGIDLGVVINECDSLTAALQALKHFATEDCAALDIAKVSMDDEVEFDDVQDDYYAVVANDGEILTIPGNALPVSTFKDLLTTKARELGIRTGKTKPNENVAIAHLYLDTNASTVCGIVNDVLLSLNTNNAIGIEPRANLYKYLPLV